MPTELEQRFPNITEWLQDGLVEIGQGSWSDAFITASDEGGVIFEGKRKYASLDAALEDLEAGIKKWQEENG
jgi:hypothetical protein